MDRKLVREQLARILSSGCFHSSKRYAAVLRFIVEWRLNGSGGRPKERTIGKEVFGRPPDYDTATDHVVRSAVAEVRKRLALYNLQSAAGELRIEIPTGSYVPEFYWPRQSASLAPSPAEQKSLSVVQAASARSQQRARLSPRWMIAGCGALIAAAIAVIAVSGSRAPDPLQAFWGPVLSSRAPILFVVGNLEGGEEPRDQNLGINPSETLTEFHNAASSTVNKYDAFTLAKLSGLMQSRGKTVRFESQSDTNFTDLQSGPTILIGLLNNSWTQRLMPKLRFTVERPTPYKVLIRDQQNPSNDAWSIDYSTPYLSVKKDYALVLRMVDPKTEQIVVMVAGITVFGTSAAGNFLCSEKQIRKLVAVAPHGWEKKNLEVVLSTNVIGGRSGPASIVATQFW